MRIPITKRLLNTANMVAPGARVADIGCDHGYLGIYLLRQGIAASVYASDLRPKPLEAARRNAERFRVTEHITFICADGLSGIDPRAVDTVICAGMGGDLVRMLLEAAPWVRNGAYTLLLQPQSGLHDLRLWLLAQGFAIEAERPVFDDGFIYATMQVRWTGKPTSCTPGESFVTKQLLDSGSADTILYIGRMLDSIEKTLTGLRKAADPGDKLAFYEQARKEVLEMRERYDNGQTGQ